MWRPYGTTRASHRSSDQAPFSPRSLCGLRCWSPFLADPLTLPQAVDTRAFPLSQSFSALAPSPPTPGSPDRTLRPYYHDVYVGIRFHCNVRPSRPVTKGHVPNCPRFKTHSIFLPNPRGFLHHAVSKPPRPRRCCCAPTDLVTWPRCFRYGPS